MNIMKINSLMRSSFRSSSGKGILPDGLSLVRLDICKSEPHLLYSLLLQCLLLHFLHLPLLLLSAVLEPNFDLLLRDVRQSAKLLFPFAVDIFIHIEKGFQLSDLLNERNTRPLHLSCTGNWLYIPDR